MAGMGRIPAIGIALMASVGAHVTVAWWAGGVELFGDESPQRAVESSLPAMLIPWADEPEPEPEPEPVAAIEPEPEKENLLEIDKLRLGIAESSIDTMNWIGYADPTPHSAMPSEVDQPALDPNAGNPGTPGPVAPPVADTALVPPSPAPPSAARPDQTPPPPPAAVEPQPETRPPNLAEEVGDAPLKPGPSGVPVEAPDDPTLPLMVEDAQEVLQAPEIREEGIVGPPASAARPPEEVRPESPPPPPTPEPAAQPVITTESGSPGSGEVPGERSDRESNAASREQSIEVRPGRPAAAEGLEIITRRPQFTRVTRLMAAPSINPRLRVTFDRLGLVRNVEFLEATGIQDVDEPVQHAVYRWTARGKALTDLPRNDPKAGVTITVTILLR